MPIVVTMASCRYRVRVISAQVTATVGGVLSSFDDFPIHQTSQPVARTGSSDLNHYDRYFFNGYTRDTRLYFAAAMGLYPNRHVADASFSVVVDGGTADARQIKAACEAGAVGGSIACPPGASCAVPPPGPGCPRV